ncbi:MAG: molybdenum cofactor guanylyltransferase [Proteobacteria bacterium]|nr:molybdenum cofactor guanylyltransferase [Pseudomonadota bacterium]
MSRLANVSGALLLGGASSRMGEDKARIVIGGVPLAARAASLLSDLFEDVLLVGDTPPSGLPGREVADLPGPRCALRGLATALDAARSERVVVLATDMPFVDAALILALTAHADCDAVVPRTDDGVHPLCAIYRRDPLAKLAQERLAAGALKLDGLLGAIDTHYLDGDDLRGLDPTGRALTNVNTLEELARVRAAT